MNKFFCSFVIISSIVVLFDAKASFPRPLPGDSRISPTSGTITREVVRESHDGSAIAVGSNIAIAQKASGDSVSQIIQIIQQQSQQSESSGQLADLLSQLIAEQRRANDIAERRLLEDQRKNAEDLAKAKAESDALAARAARKSWLQSRIDFLNTVINDHSCGGRFSPSYKYANEPEVFPKVKGFSPPATRAQQLAKQEKERLMAELSGF